MTTNRTDRLFQLTNGPESTGSLKTTAVRGGSVAIGAEGIDFFLRLGSIAILARLLVPEDFGLVSMVLAITSIADRFRDFGLGSATIQSREITHEQVSTLFWLNMGLGAALMAAIATLGYPIALFYSDPRLLLITIAVSTSFLWHGAASQHNALLRRTMKFGRLAAIQLVASALSLALAIVLALRGFGYWAIVARELSRSLVMAVGAWICCPWLPGAPWRSDGVRRMMKFGADITGANFVVFVSSSVDQVLIGRIFGAHQLGIYRQAFQLVLAPMYQLAYPVRVVTESLLSRLQDDVERYRRYYRGMLNALALATVPLGLFIAVYAEEIVLVVLGDRWIEATSILRILAIAAFLQPAVATSVGVMTTCGHSRRTLWLGLLSSVTLITFIFIGVPFGPVGVASAHIWSMWLLLLPRLYWSFRGTPVDLGTFYSAMFRPAVSSAIMVGVLLIFRRITVIEGNGARVCVGMAVALTAYFSAWLATSRGRVELISIIADLSVPVGLSGLLRRRLHPGEA